ncbi:hypothetical protein BGZ65_011851 [Modicella reniformis]|uniref:Uncharacterized protein n=1 Tax=Modicella reniformis TaxID=1440133 RepID=A0A9P6MBT7_9FUNG|nr:hypothetical protein BGZ65_011851 [Modicella reniformis]
MTLNQRPRTNVTSSLAASSATAQSVPPSVAMNHKERRNFSGSARSRLTKIDRISKMMLNPNASAPNAMDGPTSIFSSQASPRRARLSLQPQTVPVADAKSLASIQTSEPVSLIEPLPAGSSSLSSVASAVPHTPTNSSYPRHIIVRSTSPHPTLEDSDKSPSADADSFSTSLPSTPAFPAGVDPSHNGDSVAPSSSSEKVNRHASMPLLKSGWRLYDLPDVEESEQGPGEGSGNSREDRSGFQYSASNASSTTNLENHPYPYHAAAHTRQDSTSTYYTMTPNASNLDLPATSSQTNLNSMDPSVLSSPDSNLVPSSAANTYQGPTHSTATAVNLPKAIKNNKSPLALRRSSTISSTNTSSPSNTFLNKSSFPKSSLSPNAGYASKTLTQERQKIVLEILQTERSYVDGLLILQTLFYEPLNSPYATSNSGMNTTTSLYMSNSHVNGSASGTGAGTGTGAGVGTVFTTISPPYYPSTTVGSNSTLSTSAAPLLSKKSIGEIFSNFPEILQVNTLLLTQLETRICGSTLSTGWESDEDETGEESPYNGDDENRSLRQDQHSTEQKPKQVLVTVSGQNGEQEQLVVLDTDWCVGDIFVEIAPFLKMYSNYVKTYSSALTHINDCMNRNERFTEFLKATVKRQECKSLDFQAYLILPVQRIPRYKMLLESLLRHTPENHPDHRKLQTAFASMEQTATSVNETIRQHEMFVKMVELQSKIAGLSEPLVIPGRVLLKRGTLWKVCRRNVQLRVIILFSDCILWTSPSMNPLDDTLTFHRKVGLENCTVIGVEDPDPTKNAFQIINPEKSSQVYVNSLKEKEEWMEAIRKATQDYLSAKRTLKISITPMQSISAAATGFTTGLLRRETGLWSPTSFGAESRSNIFGVASGADSEVSGGLGARSSLDGVYQTSMTAAQKQQQPLRVVENYNAPTILIKGANSEKVGRACDDCIDSMFPEEANMALLPNEPPPMEQTKPSSPNNDPSRRFSQQSLDGILIRPEDYTQDTTATTSTTSPPTGATGMVRGFVEAGLNRMKSRAGQQDNNDVGGDANQKENRTSNRKSDSHLANGADSQRVAQVKECGLCKVEFSMFKWKYICSQCRRVVCSDCLTKKQSDHLFLLGLQAEEEAKTRGLDIQAEDVMEDLDKNSLDHQDQTRPGLNQSSSDSTAEIGTYSELSGTPSVRRTQSFDHNDTSNSNSSTNGGGGGYVGFGAGWRGIRGNIDSGHGQVERLCDPCYLGLSADQIKVLESGGGWQYYQATLGRNQIPGLAAALALNNMSFEDATVHEEQSTEEQMKLEQEAPKSED